MGRILYIYLTSNLYILTEVIIDYIRTKARLLLNTELSTN